MVLRHCAWTRFPAAAPAERGEFVKVFRMDEESFYAARDLQEAQAEYTSDCGRPAEEVVELADAQLDAYTIALQDENEELTGESVTFRQQLQEETNGEECDAFLLCSMDF